MNNNSTNIRNLCLAVILQALVWVSGIYDIPEAAYLTLLWVWGISVLAIIRATCSSKEYRAVHFRKRLSTMGTKVFFTHEAINVALMATLYYHHFYLTCGLWIFTWIFAQIRFQQYLRDFK